MTLPTKTHVIYRVALASMLLSATGWADIFTMKDGSILEGSILSDDPDSYLIEIQVTRSIKDERRISKDQIDRIERRNKDAEAFEKLSPLAETPDFMPASAYHDRIERLKAFVNEFPQSTFREQAEEIVAVHETELAAIEAGGIKIDGKLLTADERMENAYEVESRIKAAEIKRHVEGSNYLLALREFHILEQDFTGTKAWHELLPLMRQVSAAHRANTQRILDGYDQRVERQKAGLTLMPPEEQNRVERGIARRDEQLKARYDQERSNRSYWLSTHEFFKPSLDDTIRMADQEMRRLEAEAAKPLPSPSPAELWRNAIAAIRGGETREITDAIKAATSAKMPPRYIEQLQQLVADPE